MAELLSAIETFFREGMVSVSLHWTTWLGLVAAFVVMVFERRRKVRSLYYLFIYGRLMRLAHRFGWHHMRVTQPQPYEGDLYWCHWCGIRCLNRNPKNEGVMNEGISRG